MLFITLGQVACMSRGGGRDPARLTISAAVSLEEALQEIQQLYRRQKPDVQITYNFAGSGTLEQQIEQGAPVDVFISASPRELDALAVKGLLVEESRTDLVQNQIVLVTPRDPKLVNGFDDLTGAAVKRVALGEPETVPAGRYAKQVLTYFHLFDALQPKLIFTKDVRQALTYVATGNVDAALVYQTEARLARPMTRKTGRVASCSIEVKRELGLFLLDTGFPMPYNYQRSVKTDTNRQSR